MRCRCLLLVLIVATAGAALAQQVVRVSSHLAASHLKSDPAPAYPPLAQQARIQGNVLIQVQVDAAGNVAPVKVISGHPMLVSAALDAVRGWKYTPFEVDGRAVTAITTAVVRFGRSGREAEDVAELALQDKFWPAMDRAQTALAKGDTAAAELALSEGRAILAAAGSPGWHTPETWQLAMSTGDLRRQQKQFSEAEQQYTEALNSQKQFKDSPHAASSLSSLGTLYYHTKRPELARERLNRAIAIFRKTLKSTKLPSAQTAYSRAIAEDAWVLSRIATDESRRDEAVRQCRTLLEFKTALPPGDAKLADCERLTATSATTP